MPWRARRYRRQHMLTQCFVPEKKQMTARVAIITPRLVSAAVMHERVSTWALTISASGLWPMLAGQAEYP